MTHNRLTKYESWIIEILNRVDSGLTVEDARVELKCEWPDPDKAARRIAAHANSSFGGEILWIVGVDEKTGVVGCEPNDLASWWPQVQSQFDGVSPDVVDLVVGFSGESITGLIFGTNRPPYVVKNPVFGSIGGGAVSHLSLIHI